MTRAALDIVLNDPERYVMTEEERSQYERLAVFFGTAAVDPSRFPLSPKQAQRLKTIVKKAKGPAQPQSRRNKRKARQERRIGFAKKRRKERREYTAQYNEAMAQIRKEQEEMESAYAEAQARIEAEPKFNIVDAQGNIIMSDVPKFAIVEINELNEPDGPKIILPSDLE